MTREDDPPIDESPPPRFNCEVRPPASIVLFAFLLLTLNAGGCISTFDEVHYFKSVDKYSRPVNYYRVRVSGDTLLSSSRYVSGYYDEASLDSYFNTISQPENGAIVPVRKDNEPEAADGASDANAASATAEKKMQPLDAAKEGRKLVLLLSSNSDEIAKGISALAQSSEVATTLTNLVGAGRLRDAADAASRADLKTVRGGVLADEASQALEAVADGAQPATKDRMLGLSNALADFIGAHPTFTSLEMAQSWLLEHAGRDE